MQGLRDAIAGRRFEAHAADFLARYRHREERSDAAIQ
jgi:hypothetical protein